MDEAGKGPVIGPMIIGAVVLEEDELAILDRLGVKDSKKLSARAREQIAQQIKKRFQYYECEVSAKQIDELRRIMTMNEIMVLCYSRVLKQINASKAIVDAADVNASRFAENLRKKGCKIEIIAEHKADEKYPVVGAASILAKVKRDSCVREIERNLGQRIGSGYPSDPLTRRFLEEWIKSQGMLPDCARKSWQTSLALIKNSQGRERKH